MNMMRKIESTGALIQALPNISMMKWVIVPIKQLMVQPQITFMTTTIDIYTVQTAQSILMIITAI